MKCEYDRKENAESYFANHAVDFLVEFAPPETAFVAYFTMIALTQRVELNRLNADEAVRDFDRGGEFHVGKMLAVCFSFSLEKK